MTVTMPSNPRFLNLTGRTYNRWRVVSYAGKSGKHHLWLCRCSCGNQGTIPSTNLTGNKSKSCGCNSSEITAARNRANATHGHSGNGASGAFATAEYNAWTAMTDRCHNPKNKGFHNYGGRGIKVCDRWRESFADFLADMGTRPSAEHSLDRYPDNDGDYKPGNCRWATKKEQDRNKRTNRLLTHQGVTLCVTEWAERTGINKRTIFTRLRKGWPAERALA